MTSLWEYDRAVRGEATISDNDDNKETDEFGLGKNLL